MNEKSILTLISVVQDSIINVMDYMMMYKDTLIEQDKEKLINRINRLEDIIIELKNLQESLNE